MELEELEVGMLVELTEDFGCITKKGEVMEVKEIRSGFMRCCVLSHEQNCDLRPSRVDLRYGVKKYTPLVKRVLYTFETREDLVQFGRVVVTHSDYYNSCKYEITSIIDPEAWCAEIVGSCAFYKKLTEIAVEERSTVELVPYRGIRELNEIRDYL